MAAFRCTAARDNIMYAYQVFPVTVNTFKGKLDMVRRTKMGFFEDYT